MSSEKAQVLQKQIIWDTLVVLGLRFGSEVVLDAVAQLHGKEHQLRDLIDKSRLAFMEKAEDAMIGLIRVKELELAGKGKQA